MSVKHFSRSNNGFYDVFSSVLLIIIVFTSIYFFPCGAENIGVSETDEKSSNKIDLLTHHLFRRSSGKHCQNSSECSSELRGSVCIQNRCVCPQGYLPDKQGTIGCFHVGKRLGNYCNISAQCEDLSCQNNVCLCPEGSQFFHIQGANMCLFWHRPTRTVDRCIRNDECTRQDVNTVCKKRWCQCSEGFQLFETMLFGKKQKCFKTYRFHQCHNSGQCSNVAKSPDHYCLCSLGVCHCLTDLNSTSLDIPTWAEKPNWYQRWKKDLILATRLLFITVILFFVPCFIYVTLGVRERSRQLFSQFVQPSRSAAVHYTQRRMSQLRPLRSYRGLSDVGSAPAALGEVHHVEISLQPNGINSRLVDSRPRILPPLYSCEATRDIHTHDADSNAKEEDPPPSYEEIMRRDMYSEAPPPPYREL